MPPSINAEGKAYTVVDFSEAVDAPEWLLNLVAPLPQVNENGPYPHTPLNQNVSTPELEAAIEKELSQVDTAPGGTRNHALNKAAFALGQWVGSGALSEDEARTRLFQAAEVCRLVADDGERSVIKTIESGLQSGKKKPRQVPQERSFENRILPPPSPVPLEAFPPEVRVMLEEAAKAFRVPLQIPTACMLAFLARLVGRSRLISIKESWVEAGNLWIAVVADSGMGKSPCMKAFIRPVEILEYQAKQEFDELYLNYEDELYQYQTQRNINAKQKAKKGSSEEVVLLMRPKEPIRKQATVDDSTIESLGNALQANTKGLMWDKDELAGLMADADRYSNSSGGQRARLLSAYDSGSWKVERISDPRRNLYISKACISIFGGIQPGMMSKVFEAGITGVDEASGFLQRFTFIRAEAERASYWTEQTFSRESKKLLERLAGHLWKWDIEYDAEEREIEPIVPVSSGAKAVFIDWYNGVAVESFLSSNKGLLEKLNAKALRICLLLHSLDAALAGNDGMGIITEDCMQRAILLANWIKEHQEQCWRFFTPGKRPKRINPIELAIMQVVIEQAAKIEADGWKISNEELFSLVREKLEMPGLAPEKIGKAAVRLGLSECWAASNQRGRTITKENIVSFQSTVGSVGCVGSPTSVGV